MTATPILETLAREFSTSADHVRNALEMLDAGLSAPFIGRFRRPQVGSLSESFVRRLDFRRQELAELDRRRGTILRVLERDNEGEATRLDPIRQCMDRFELEDLFIPHRRPEPEVQLALDRGLGALADLLTAPNAEAVAAAKEAAAAAKASKQAASKEKEATAASESDAGSTDAESAEAATSESGTSESAEAETTPEPAQVSETPSATGGAADSTPAPDEAESAPEAKPSEPAEAAAPSEPTGAPAAAQATAQPAAEASATPDGVAAAALTPQLAKLCAPFVSPDRGIHTEAEALSGAMRILSDRLGRSPRLRGSVRALLRKQGILSVRANVDEGKAGRHRSLLKMRQPLRQLQGHRLLAIRQAQKERILNTVVDLDRAKVLPKVRAGLGRHTHLDYAGVLDEVASRALEHRLLPMVEADVRLELKERGDAEALRFLSQHLRQVLLTPPLGRHPAVGVDVSAKGDWTVVPLDADGGVAGPPAKIEAKTAEGEVKDAAALGAELAPHVSREAWGIAVGHGKGARAAVSKLRAALAAAGLETFVFVVNEAGLSSYANSQLARSELGDLSVPQRMAASLGRRLQDPLAEILKVDPRHLGLGAEQGLVSKANLKRAFNETVESCVAHVGCDLNRAPRSVLMHVPGLDAETVERLIARRTEKRFTSREELRHDGLVTEAQWTNSIAFLRLPGSSEPLDATSLHPEQYDLVRRILGSAGSSVEEGLRSAGVTKGLRSADFEVDEGTWRDLMREIAYPGRDPRPRLMRPQLLDPGTDPVRLTKDRVVMGTVSNVASFGAFLDIGLPHDAMVHISEVSDHYVRDVRELLSIGQTIRAKIIDGSGQRVSLSLKRVPPPPRADRGGGGGRGGERRGGGGGGGGRDRGKRGGWRDRDEPKVDPNLRAAQTRRDGLGGASTGGRAGARRGGGGGPGGRRGGSDRRRDPDDVGRVDLKKVNQASDKGFSPFANFFKEGGEEETKDQPDA